MLTPYQSYRKLKNLTSIEMFSVEIAIEKEQKKEKKRFQNKCVSSQNRRYKKRRGRYRSGVSPTFPQRAASLFRRAVLGSKQRQIQTIGKYS